MKNKKRETTNVLNSNFVELQATYPASKGLGGLIGLLVGDAVGVPYEFNSPSHLPPRERIDMVPPVDFDRSHVGTPVGTWSDDGAQALCLFASCLEPDGFDIEDLARRLCDWRNNGYMAVDRRVFDIGNQTDAAIDLLEHGISPFEAGGRTEQCNGNGSLMRVLPLALLHDQMDALLVQEAHLQSVPTHAHPRSQVVCAWYCLVARAYLDGDEDPWNTAYVRLFQIYREWVIEDERAGLLAELDNVMYSPFRNKPSGSGYVVDTFWSVKRAMEENTFEGVIKTAIAMGGDTDTTACVAGGLAGIRFGLGGIPIRWLAQLRGWELVEPLIFHSQE